MHKKILNDYFDNNIDWWGQQTENEELANLFNLLEAKVSAEKDQAFRKLESYSLNSLAPEFSVSNPPISLIHMSELSRSGLIKAGSAVEVRDHLGQLHKFSLMFDESLAKCQLCNVYARDKRLFLEVKLYENTNKIPLYISDYGLLCQLLCNKNKKVFINQTECGYLKPRLRKEFLPNRVNPYFLIYQVSLSPMQYNFFDVYFSEELKPNNYRIEIDLLQDIFNLEDEVKINCVPIVGLFEEYSGYTKSPIAAKTEIFEVVEVMAYNEDKNKEVELEDCKVIIEHNVAYIEHSGLLSAKIRCIADCRNAALVKCDFGEASSVAFLSNIYNKKTDYEKILDIFKKDIFSDSQNVHKINELYGLPKIDVKVSLTGGVKKNIHWSAACPKYIVSLSISNFSFIGYAIAWALTFQKLCDIARLCDVKIITSFGTYTIEDECEW